MALSSIVVTYSGNKKVVTSDTLRALHAMLVFFWDDICANFRDWKDRGEPDEHLWNELALVIDWYNSNNPSIEIPNLEKRDLVKEKKIKAGYFYDQEPLEKE
jgi:hypothetical protein